MEETEWTVSDAEAGKRLDLAASRALGISRSRAARLIAHGAVLVGGATAEPSRLLRAGERVSAMPPTSPPGAGDRDAMAARDPTVDGATLDVIYEDAHIIVVNKPRGLVVHPAAGHPDGTLVDAVLSHADDLSGIGGEHRPGIVHRLDKDTTGLLVIAKTDDAHLSLQQQIQARTAERVYTGIVWGSPEFNTATVRASVGRHPTDRKRMAVLPDGTTGSRMAVTHLSVTARHGPFSVIEARLETGRTHQIRVHCAYIGHPIVGDPVYGGARHLPPKVVPPPELKVLTSALEGLG
ncbi:MAG: RluA family pseudouridine synthase, partial [Armatimonadetes bacterium]|nr:RluA family pseudouridine synthase [Armatimonadota bacterium]